MAKKKAATKKKATRTTRSTKTVKKVSSTSPSFKHRYVSERDSFFEAHPRAKYLLGGLIVAFVFYLAHLWYVKQLEVQIGETLEAEGIRYIPESL